MLTWRRSRRLNGDHQDAVFVIRNVQPVSVDPAGALPPPFQARDVGAASVPGSATYAGGAFTVRSAGADIWGTADSFRFVYRTMAGDGTIVARLTGITATHESAKAGLMMREGLAANARHVSVLVTPGFGALLQRRDATGGASATRGSRPAAPPRWLKLERRGNAFSGYVSADRQTWSLVASSTVAMGTDLLVGLAVSSHDPAKTNTATFDQVEVTD